MITQTRRFVFTFIVGHACALNITTGAEAVLHATFGPGSGSVWLDDVSCTGEETTLVSCSANPIGSHNCGHSEDAGVRCRGTLMEPVYVHIN